MFIADSHSDTLFTLAHGKTQPQELMITPDKLRKGGISLQVLALWTGPDGNKGDVAGIVQGELSQLPFFLQNGIRQVDDPKDVQENEHCCMLSVEGGEVFEPSLETVAAYREKGVRIAAIVWNNENALAHPAKNGSKQGLTAYGKQVVAQMHHHRMAVDVSHLNEAGFYDLFDNFDKAPMASHSCCRALCNHSRNLTDEQLKIMIQAGGYVGVNFYPFFLQNEGQATVDTVACHIDHICQLGGENIVGFGSDFDGIESTPTHLSGADQIPNLLEALRKRGYPEKTLHRIAGENFRDYFGRL